MSDESARTDITNQIRGEIRDNAMILSLNGKPIGHIPFDAACVQMDQGFEVDDQRIFRIENMILPKPDQYVDCDGQGWC